MPNIYLFLPDGKINIDLFKILNNTKDFLEITSLDNRNEKYYTISFRKDYDINIEIDKLIFSYLEYYV